MIFQPRRFGKFEIDLRVQGSVNYRCLSVGADKIGEAAFAGTTQLNDPCAVRKRDLRAIPSAAPCLHAAVQDHRINAPRCQVLCRIPAQFLPRPHTVTTGSRPAVHVRQHGRIVCLQRIIGVKVDAAWNRPLGAVGGFADIKNSNCAPFFQPASQGLRDRYFFSRYS